MNNYKKIRPSEKKSKEIQQIWEREGALSMEEFHRLGQEKLYQEALEAEADAFLGRKWHKRAEKGAHTGYRNGYSVRRVRVPGSRLEVWLPKMRKTGRRKFVSRLLKGCVQITDKLRSLALEMYVRGLSTRDIEEAFVDQKGKPFLGRTAVSQLSGRLYEEYERFSKRDLSTLDVVFLFVDGVYESVRKYTNGQPLLCAWAICSDGTKQFLHLSAVQSESAEAWEGFFKEMQARGLRQPLLVISDGGGGVVAGIEECFPLADRQRCIAHKLRNLYAKLPKDVAAQLLLEFKAVYYAADRSAAELLAAKIIEKYAQVYPGAMQCFSEDLEACLVHLKYPEGHRRYIRTTNLLERTFEEEKRRTKVLPQHQHERGAVGLVFGVLWRASNNWQHVSMTPLELTQLRNIRALVCPDNKSTGFISYELAA
jgi:transposase-like protein